MKYIIKNSEPIEFGKWKALANDNWKPTYSDLRGNEKTDVHISLMEEQGYICCYCESRKKIIKVCLENFGQLSNNYLDKTTNKLLL
jgi:hypothetical protein